MEQDILVGPSNLVAPGIVSVDSQGASSVTINLESADTPTGFSYVIEGTGDGTNWFAVGGVDPTLAGTALRGVQTAVTGQWVVPCGGLQKVRFNLQAITGGTATVSLNAGAGTSSVNIAGGIIRLINSFVTPTPGTGGGLTTSALQVPNNVTAIVVKASPGVLYGIRTWNLGNTVAYIKLYNDTTAIAGAGTVFDRVAIPPGYNKVDFGADMGVAYGTGIVAIITTDYADNGTTPPSANDYQVSFDYK